ncbi:dienelactone hydrolase [Sediminibacillus dalangtanensis]|uniref:Dienelactone hydrolase n=1 Tax=Sediminibacillus dalangtanensis TaxID=2729421 RepID=A0ABX7VR82_9BACI|nr:alpha/beta hydrolase family protein [Sediminibacillus dalangtanensis]QTM99166.1 dienelactone hydrolase [Sediminibacillus dalangtanensis]
MEMGKTLEQFFIDEYNRVPVLKRTFEQYESQREKMKLELKHLLGDFSDWDKIPSVPVIESVEEFEDYRQERFKVRLGNQLDVPIYVLTPLQAKTTFPTVLALHGHGYGPKQIIGLTRQGIRNLSATTQTNYALQMVKRGCKVFAPALLGKGERIFQADAEAGKDKSCERLAQLFLMQGKTLLGARVWEARKLLDVMTSFDDVLPRNIGVFGFSGGAAVAGFTAILDERLRAAVLAGYPSLFRDSILDKPHCLDNYLPGVLNLSELPGLLGLVSPRPIFIETGEKDPLFPLDSASVAISQLEKIYLQSGRPEAFGFHIHNGGHEVDGGLSYDWLLRQLI